MQGPQILIQQFVVVEWCQQANYYIVKVADIVNFFRKLWNISRITFVWNVNFSLCDFLPYLWNLSPTVEFSLRNYVTGLDINSTYTQMSYFISQLDARKSERGIKLAIRDKLTPKTCRAFENLVKPRGGRITPPCITSLFEGQWPWNLVVPYYVKSSTRK